MAYQPTNHNESNGLIWIAVAGAGSVWVLASAPRAARAGDVMINALRLGVRVGTEVVREADNPARALFRILGNAVVTASTGLRVVAREAFYAGGIVALQVFLMPQHIEVWLFGTGQTQVGVIQIPNTDLASADLQGQDIGQALNGVDPNHPDIQDAIRRIQESMEQALASEDNGTALEADEAHDQLAIEAPESQGGNAYANMFERGGQPGRDRGQPTAEEIGIHGPPVERTPRRDVERFRGGEGAGRGEGSLRGEGSQRGEGPERRIEGLQQGSEGLRSSESHQGSEDPRRGVEATRGGVEGPLSSFEALRLSGEGPRDGQRRRGGQIPRGSEGRRGGWGARRGGTGTRSSSALAVDNNTSPERGTKRGRDSDSDPAESAGKKRKVDEDYRQYCTGVKPNGEKCSRSRRKTSRDDESTYACCKAHGSNDTASSDGDAEGEVEVMEDSEMMEVDGEQEVEEEDDDDEDDDDDYEEL